MDRASRTKFGVVLIVAAAVVVLTVAHAPYINGPWYWMWRWRDASDWPVPAWKWYSALLAAALPIIAAWFVSQRWVAIVLLMIGVVTVKLTSVSIDAQPASFKKLAAIIRSPQATSYFSDASALADKSDWLANYPDILPLTNLHTQSKPPGAVAFYMLFIRAIGYGERAAIVAGIVQAILAALALPAVYWMIRVLGSEDLKARAATTLVAVCPGFLIVYPDFDAGWIIFAAAMIATWHLAISRRSRPWAIAFAVTLAVTCFFTYNLLTLGLFLAAWMFVARARARDAVSLGAVALVTCAALYLLFWLVKGFDPIATFFAALRNQHNLLEIYKSQRPYPWTILFDLTDFALSAGWIVIALAILGLARVWRAPEKWLVIICLMQPVIIAITGLLQAETARVWNFMLPLLALPAAIELSAWPRGCRIATYAALLLIALVIGHQTLFVMP